MNAKQSKDKKKHVVKYEKYDIFLIESYIFDAVFDGFKRKKAGSVDRLSVVVGSPRRAVNINVVAVEAERRRFYKIRHLAIEHTYATNAWVVRNANTANAVSGYGRYLAGTSRSVSASSW